MNREHLEPWTIEKGDDGKWYARMYGPFYSAEGVERIVYRQRGGFWKRENAERAAAMLVLEGDEG